MKKIDRIFWNLVILPVVPILLFLTGWWGGLLIVPDNIVFIPAITGLMLGIIVDFLWVRKSVVKVYQWKPFYFWLIVLFYTLGMFGFFMGFPVFHPILGIIIGFYITRKGAVLGWGKKKFNQEIKKSYSLGLGIMLMICIATGTVSLIDPYTASMVENMFSLPFKITRQMLVALTLVGSLILVTGEYVLIRMTVLICQKKIK